MKLEEMKAIADASEKDFSWLELEQIVTAEELNFIAMCGNYIDKLLKVVEAAKKVAVATGLTVEDEIRTMKEALDDLEKE